MANLFVISSLILLFVSISYCLPKTETEEYWEDEEPAPVTVQMACTQYSTDVHCKFYFTNNGHEDYYLLKRNTPLEGLRSHFLTVTHGKRILQYEGRIIHRLPATRDEYILIQAGDTISSASIEINRAYKFPHDGQYSIQYTGPLVYFSSNSMNTLQDEEIPQATIRQISTLSTTMIEVQDVDKLRQLDKEEEIGDESINDDEKVYINNNACPIHYNRVSQARQNIITPLHEAMCGINGFSKSISLIDARPKSTTARYIYRRWFGAADPNVVKHKLTLILNGLRGGTEYSNGKTGPLNCCGQATAYAYFGVNKLFLCAPFNDLIDTCTISGTYCKRLVIAHEWSHAFADTYDHAYGGDASQELAKSDAGQAASNADNFGYFYLDVYNL